MSHQNSTEWRKIIRFMFLYFYVFQQKLKYMCLQYLSSLFPYPYLQHTHTHPTDIHPICVCVCQQLSHGLQPARFLCSWNSPSKNIGVGSHFLLLGIFPTQGPNLGLLLYHVSHQGSPCPFYACTTLIFLYSYFGNYAANTGLT